MFLDTFLEKSNHLEIIEERQDEELYKEFVFLSKELSAWSSLLEEFFGPARKPAGEKPSKADESLTQNFGGIRKDQTLFIKDLEGKKALAALWPWQDGRHITLKLVLI